MASKPKIQKPDPPPEVDQDIKDVQSQVAPQAAIKEAEAAAEAARRRQGRAALLIPLGSRGMASGIVS